MGFERILLISGLLRDGSFSTSTTLVDL